MYWGGGGLFIDNPQMKILLGVCVCVCPSLSVCLSVSPSLFLSLSVSLSVSLFSVCFSLCLSVSHSCHTHSLSLLSPARSAIVASRATPPLLPPAPRTQTCAAPRARPCVYPERSAGCRSAKRARTFVYRGNHTQMVMLLLEVDENPLHVGGHG